MAATWNEQTQSWNESTTSWNEADSAGSGGSAGNSGGVIWNENTQTWDETTSTWDAVGTGGGVSGTVQAPKWIARRLSVAVRAVSRVLRAAPASTSRRLKVSNRLGTTDTPDYLPGGGSASGDGSVAGATWNENSQTWDQASQTWNG